MKTIRYFYWKEEDAWLGYFEAFPDHWTQGETLDDLIEHLRDLYQDLTSGEIPGIRGPGELKMGGIGDLMKRVDLIRELVGSGCELVRHGSRHDWYRNPATGIAQAVPRHREIKERLARHILRSLANTGGGPGSDRSEA